MTTATEADSDGRSTRRPVAAGSYWAKGPLWLVILQSKRSIPACAALPSRSPIQHAGIFSRPLKRMRPTARPCWPVDAMLKHLGLTEGSVYKRIDAAVGQHILTKAMGQWAHEVRLGSNRPRHADIKEPHVTSQQAEQSVDFAEALGHYLFVLPSRVTRGIAAAKAGETGASDA